MTLKIMQKMFVTAILVVTIVLSVATCAFFIFAFRVGLPFFQSVKHCNSSANYIFLISATFPNLQFHPYVNMLTHICISSPLLLTYASPQLLFADTYVTILCRTTFFVLGTSNLFSLQMLTNKICFLREILLMYLCIKKHFFFSCHVPKVY